MKMVWKILLFLVMTAVIIGAFVTASPMNPAISVGSPDAYRIFYFHVPQAWVASLSFLVAMFYSIRYLQTRRMAFDIRAAAANRLGLFFAVIATVTGSIFAKMTWGEFWNWSEIREVSIFLLMVIYGAYFALRSAVADPDKRASLSAVTSILFAMAAIFLIFVLPRMYAEFSQHPSDSVVDEEGQITMGRTVALIFFSSLAAFTALYVWMYRLTIRVDETGHNRTLEGD